jgi:hypothetical protein
MEESIFMTEAYCALCAGKSAAAKHIIQEKQQHGCTLTIKIEAWFTLRIMKQ